MLMYLLNKIYFIPTKLMPCNGEYINVFQNQYLQDTTTECCFIYICSSGSVKPLGVGSYTPINSALGGVESPSLLFTWAIPVWRVHVAGVGILHFSRPECVDGEVQQGPSPAGYNAEPVPRVTGEDFNKWRHIARATISRENASLSTTSILSRMYD